ncbi:hypothetical protein EHP00_561 [Ecytonucleospora hepatopenaei]|uniref:Uncharacterized protein n=1 Tax=Ecytonucleospora hepatopenaei TaxID=646526 RepID=A0A1W0E8F5_9MICR|nr:hypothetical protein EHP00_561 [Ecytonucleospora hepatopenaei]
MTYIFKEINEKILKFRKEEQIQLVKYYIDTALKKLTDNKTVFNNKKLILLLNILKYAKNEESKKLLIQVGLSNKINNARTMILDLIDIDFSGEQKVFYRPDKWIGIVLKDILETFDYERILDDNILKTNRGLEKINLTDEKVMHAKEFIIEKDEKPEIKSSEIEYKVVKFNDNIDSEDLLLCLEIYNKKLCSAFVNIFCSCDKFNSSGNQLLLNLVAYIDKMSFLNYDFYSFLRKIKMNFLENKSMKMEDIVTSFLTYKHDKKNKKKETKQAPNLDK